MSYCRRGEDGSDAYIYWAGEPDCVRCSNCSRNVLGNHYDAPSFTDMLAHVAWHRTAGDHIPAHVDEELRDDAATYDDDPTRECID